MATPQGDPTVLVLESDGEENCIRYFVDEKCDECSIMIYIIYIATCLLY